MAFTCIKHSSTKSISYATQNVIIFVYTLGVYESSACGTNGLFKRMLPEIGLHSQKCSNCHSK